MLLGVELGYRLGETEIEDDGVAFLFDRNLICCRSGAVGNGEVHRVGEVTRNTCSRRKGGTFGSIDRRDEGFEIRSNRHCYIDGTRHLVDDTDIELVEREREDTCLIVLDAQFIIQIHVAVLHMNDNR